MTSLTIEAVVRYSTTLPRHNTKDRRSDRQEPAGAAYRHAVHEVKDKTVVVDLNHPLAGKTLNFDVKVTDIKAAEAK